MKSSGGVWNFTGLQRRFGDKKTDGKELLIEQFVLKDGSLQVNGQGVKGISFRLFNLATKGSQQAALTLSLEDVVRNVYRSRGRPVPDLTPLLT